MCVSGSKRTIWRELKFVPRQRLDSNSVPGPWHSTVNHDVEDYNVPRRLIAPPRGAAAHDGHIRSVR
jgi:hypothetical protein